ncbi:USP8 [Symbiodinium natans]|uniref:Ubiquitin carboxyl-terminal hydrolase n=1 Tax=Symbiodinium natans TaxID=878477 RepID=A0A812RSC8_9DINO|nr:USP8 [Symbiodinium natans]
MQIFVKTCTGKRPPLEVEATDTVGTVKEQICGKEGIPPEQHILSFAGTVLSDGHALTAYHIKAQDTLELERMVSGPKPVSVILQRINGETSKLEATSADTTEQLKRRIFESCDIPEAEQQLCFQSQRLEDGQKPFEFLSESEHMITLVKVVPQMTLCIQFLNGGRHDMCVNCSDTVGQLKEKIQDAHGVPLDQQVLVYAGQQLQDVNKVLGDCNIQGNIFCVVRTKKPGPTYGVTVKVLSGQSFEIDVNPADTIQEVKAQIAKRASVPAEKQRLVFAGKQLSDSATVSECRIEDGNTLHLVVRLTVPGEGSSDSQAVCALRGTCESPGACGLLNLGNTCYLNSTLQALSNTVALRRYYEDGHYKADISSTPDSMGGRLADGFANLLRSIWGNEFRIVKPHEVRNLISEKWSQFAGYRQHDAQELLMFLLDGLHEDVKRTPSSSSSEAAESAESHAGFSQEVIARQPTDSKIMDIFHFQVRSTTTFCDVGARSEKFEPMVYLTLPIPGQEDDAPTERSLEDCMNAFSKQEELCQDDWVWCDQTQQRERSLKKIELWTAPECLIIHLKRFVADSSSIEKDNTFVHFPFELDLSQWLSGGPQMEGEQYRLYAVVNHTGSLSFGHYTAYCKVGEGSDKKWYLFNDARVTPASESDVVSQEAYLLFYERF